MADWYVDCRASGADNGSSWADAFTAIQPAVDAAASGDTVWVADGVYAPVALATQKDVALRSTNGWGGCVIDGGGTARCVTAPVYRTGPHRLQLHGFILRNGKSAGYGGGAYYADLHRCEVTGCSASAGGGTYETSVYDCLIHHNTATGYGGGIYYGDVFNSTIVFNTGRSGGFYNGYFNSVYRFNRTPAGVEVNHHTAAYLHNATASAIFPYQESGGGNTIADPLLTPDFRLRADSPCIGTGRLDLVQSDLDIAGNPRTTAGTVCMGCFEFKGGILPTRLTMLGGKQ